MKLKLVLGFLVIIGLTVSGVFLVKSRPAQVVNKKDVKKEGKKWGSYQKKEKETLEKTNKQGSVPPPVPGFEFLFSGEGKIYQYQDGQVKEIAQGSHPRYARDGNKMLFSRDIDGDGFGDEIWLRDFETSQEKVVTKGSYADWTGGKNEIVLWRWIDNQTFLLKHNFLSGREEVIKNDIWNVNGLDCSEQGMALLDLSGGEGEPEIYAINLDGSGFKRLIYGGSPRWSADGSKITYSQNSPVPPYNISIYVYDVKIGRSQEIIPKEERNLYSPTFLRNGEKILFVRQQETGFEIVLMDWKTKNIKVLFNSPSEVKEVSAK